MAKKLGLSEEITRWGGILFTAKAEMFIGQSGNLFNKAQIGITLGYYTMPKPGERRHHDAYIVALRDQDTFEVVNPKVERIMRELIDTCRYVVVGARGYLATGTDKPLMHCDDLLIHCEVIGCKGWTDHRSSNGQWLCTDHEPKLETEPEKPKARKPRATRKSKEENK